jgi:hypothetical protein
VWRCGKAEEIPAIIGMADKLDELVEKRVIALDKKAWSVIASH